MDERITGQPGVPGAERGRRPSGATGRGEPQSEAPGQGVTPPDPPLEGYPPEPDPGPEPGASGPEPAEDAGDPVSESEVQDSAPKLCPRARGSGSRPRRRKGRRLVKPPEAGEERTFSAPDRILLLDTWQRSGLPAKDFAALVGLHTHTLYGWKRRFEKEGPEGLTDRPRGGPKGSRLSEITKRTILMLKEGHPDWGCQRISDMLFRGPALQASPGAVARVLKEAGYEFEEVTTRAHGDKIRRFERARPNQLWQTDLFTFVLKRQNRRVYLVAFMDDHSRFVVSFGLHASSSTALVLETLRSGIASYQAPDEILTDNGPQYVTWRGKSAFAKECEKRGIRQIVAKPRRPQTLGKVERFWGTLWRECLEAAVFIDLADARTRIGHFIDYYNFLRCHQGIAGLVPADRFFEAAPDVLRTLKERVAANALELARHGIPKKPFYLTGQVEGKPFSVHAEGERVILTKEDGSREEVDLVKPAEGEKIDLPAPICPEAELDSAVSGGGDEEPAAPGASALDALDGGGAETPETVATEDDEEDNEDDDTAPLTQ